MSHMTCWVNLHICDIITNVSGLSTSLLSSDEAATYIVSSCLVHYWGLGIYEAMWSFAVVYIAAQLLMRAICMWYIMNWYNDIYGQDTLHMREWIYIGRGFNFALWLIAAVAGCPSKQGADSMWDLRFRSIE